MWFPPFRWLRRRFAILLDARDARLVAKEGNRPLPARRSRNPIYVMQRRYHAWQVRRDEKEMAAPTGAADRPLLRERYWEFRHWLWETWQSMPDWPIYGRVLAGLLPVVLITGVGVGIAQQLKSGPKLTDQQRLEKLFEQSKRGAANDDRIFIIGDLGAYIMTSLVEGAYIAPGVRGSGRGLFTCGILDDATVIRGKQVPIRPECKPWRAEFASLSAAFEPTATFLSVGPMEAYDLVVNGQVIAAATPEHAQHLSAQLQAAYDALTTPDTTLFLPTVPTCAVGNGSGNTAAINEFFRTYTANNPEAFRLADLDEKICDNGKPVEIDGKPAYGAKGVLSEEAARYIWDWYATLAKQAANDR